MNSLLFVALWNHMDGMSRLVCTRMHCIEKVFSCWSRPLVGWNGFRRKYRGPFKSRKWLLADAGLTPLTSGRCYRPSLPSSLCLCRLATWTNVRECGGRAPWLTRTNPPEVPGRMWRKKCGGGSGGCRQTMSDIWWCTVTDTNGMPARRRRLNR